MSDCPTPHKIKYGTQLEAKIAARPRGKRKPKRQQPGKGQLNAYRCAGCGYWHLTTMPKTALHRLRRRRRAAGE